MTRQTRKGFTLIELLVVISIIALLIGILLPALQRAKRNANALKDGTQLKQIHTALVTFATGNNDRFPVPSALDARGFTEGAALFESTSGDAPSDPMRYEKNRSGPIFSILIFNGSIVPELCISPNEVNGSIESDADFHFSPDPDVNGVNSGFAIWDPTFAGTPAEEDGARNLDNAPEVEPIGGNLSYAHQPLDGGSGNRQSRYWRFSSRASDPVLSNRGPAYSGTGATGGEGGSAEQVAATPASGSWSLAGGGDANIGADSPTLNFAGSTNSWSGNVAYNDNHVTLEPTEQPESVTFTDRNQTPAQQVIDNIFVDEENEGDNSEVFQRSNAYMRIWGIGINFIDNTDLTENSLTESIYLDGNRDLGPDSN